MQIETIEQLETAVDEDKRDHPIKEMANLFLRANTDWRTGGEVMDDFVAALKAFYGKPLSIESIERKWQLVSAASHVWEFEAGSSILEMLRKAKAYGLKDDLDTVLTAILQFYRGDGAPLRANLIIKNRCTTL